MSLNRKVCDHLKALRFITPDKLECKECIEKGDSWLHLRICLTCGGVHCCDSSKNKHASKHYHQTGHPVIVSGEPGERWAWCYLDKQMVEYAL